MNENANKDNVLIYFTDGEGESELGVKPKTKHVIWVLADKTRTLSVQNPPGIIRHFEKEARWTESLAKAVITRRTAHVHRCKSGRLIDILTNAHES